MSFRPHSVRPIQALSGRIPQTQEYVPLPQGMLQGRQLWQLTLPLLSRKSHYLQVFFLIPSTKSSPEILQRLSETKQSTERELLEVFPMDSSAALFIQRRDWALPPTFMARMTNINWETDLGQLPIWMLEVFGCCCGCSLQPHECLWAGLVAVWPQGHACIPQLGTASKSFRSLWMNKSIYRVKVKRWRCMQGARGNTGVSVRQCENSSINWIFTE